MRGIFTSFAASAGSCLISSLSPKTTIKSFAFSRIVNSLRRVRAEQQLSFCNGTKKKKKNKAGFGCASLFSHDVEVALGSTVQGYFENSG
jgi:hypothetical protein